MAMHASIVEPSDGPESPADPEGVTDRGPRPYDYYVVLILALVATVSSIDRTLISTVAEPIKREFHLTDSALGLVTGMVFAVSFAAFGIPLGLLIDRMRRTTLIAVMLALWSILTALTGFARSYGALALARVGVGAAESGGGATAMSIISDYFPPRRRGSALSLYYLSTPTGVAFGFAFGGMIAQDLGWRTAFFLAGIPGLILSTLILLTVREPTRGALDADHNSSVDAHGLAAGFACLIRIRPLLYLLIAGVLVTAAQSGLSAFAAPFLMRVHHISIAQAGFALGLAQLAGGYTGVLVGGILTDRVAQRSPQAPALITAYMIWLTAPIAIIALLLDNWVAAVTVWAGQLFLNFCYYGPHFSTYMSMSPPRQRGAVASIQIVLMTLVGYGVGPVLVGGASDIFKANGVTDSLRWGMIVTATIFVIAGFFYWAAARAIRRGSQNP